MKFACLPTILALFTTLLHAAIPDSSVRIKTRTLGSSPPGILPRNPDIEPSMLARATQLADFEGKRLKGSVGASVYLVLDNKLRHIVDTTVYENLFGSKTVTFELIPQPLIDLYPKGPPLDAHTPLVKGFDHPVCLIDDGRKRWITSTDAFNRYAFAWGKVVEIGSIIDLVPTGPNIS